MTSIKKPVSNCFNTDFFNINYEKEFSNELFRVGGEGQSPVSRHIRYVDVSLPGFKGVELPHPPAIAVIGILGLGLDYVSVDGESGECIVDGHVLSERESNPVGSVCNGDGMLGRVDGQAFERDFTGGGHRDHVHLGYI